MCKIKYDCQVDCFHMSNLLFDLAESKARNRVITNHIDRLNVSRTVATGLENSQIPIINIFDKLSQDKLFKMVIDKLSGEDCKVAL